MSKELIVAPSPHETKVVLLEDGQVVEFYVEREKEIGLVGSIYKGRVTRVLPGMQSAFVDIGLERDAFLYVSDFFEGLEDYEPGAVPELAGPPVEIEPDQDEAQPTEEPEPEPQPEPQAEAQPEEQPEEDDDRQPAFLSNEPPLRLPEQAPRRRGRRRGGRQRRGGRGPFRGQPSSFNREGSRRETAPRQEAPAPPAGEPIVLPGESLAKYRNRPPSSPAQAVETTVVEQEPEQKATVAETESQAPPAEATAATPTQVGVRKEASAPEKPAEEQPVEATPPAAEPETSKQEAPAAEPHAEESAELEAAPENVAPAPSTEPAAKEEPGEPRPAQPAGQPAGAEAANGGGTAPPESYPDAMTLAEIQRVRQYEDQVALPPSLQERTAGGVEWERGRRGGRRRGGRRDRDGRRDRARGRGRGRSGRGRSYRSRDRRPGGQRRITPARPSRGQPAIAELLRPGQEIIVQIAKEQMGKKGARITSHVTLPGRFLVYMPTIDHIGISRRIGTSEERSRLRRQLLELKGTISGGFVVRTAAAGCSEDDLRRDMDYLIKLWHEMRVRADESPAPTLLHRDLGLVQRLLRDQLTTDYEAVWVDTEEEYTRIVDLVAQFQPDMVRRIKLYSKPEPIFEAMGVQQEIDRALRPKVWLKSGGYIVINQTEALVAIDVNTGKYVGKGSTRLEDTIVKTNIEAIDEIVRQIRLRDLGGIIVIDFIDMEDSRNRHRVMRSLEAALRNDRSPSKLLSFNEFGLVAITRKRSRQSLERLLCQPCPTCTGTGLVKSIQTLSYEIQTEALKMAESIDAPELTIRAHPEIVRSLKSRENTLVREMEQTTGKNIILQSDNGLHIEEYNIY